MTFPDAWPRAMAKSRLHSAVIAGERGTTYGVVPTLRALPGPLCRYESIIPLADDAWLLTELSNVVAYPCRHSRAEDRHHGHSLPCHPERSEGSHARGKRR